MHISMHTLHMRASTLHPFFHAELHYLMYLHYCKGMFRVVVGVDVNTKISANITRNYCKGRFKVVVGININKT